MNKKYKALDIANYIIWYVNEEALGTITPLKLQKILYYVSTTYIKFNNEALFPESFEKWQYGPVVTEVYHTFKMYGFSRIISPKSTIEQDNSSALGVKKVDFNPQRFLIDDEFIKYTNNVISKLIKKEAFDLVEMTHQESAWKDYEKEILAGTKELKYTFDELRAAQDVI